MNTRALIGVLPLIVPILTVGNLHAATVRTASEAFVTNRIAAVAVASTNYTDTAVAAIPAPDYSTNNVELTNTIAQVAPAPGDYANVSNRAMKAVQTTDMDWLDVVAKTGRITTDAMGASYFFNGTADYAYKLMSEDGNHLLLLIDGRWTGFDWAGIQYRPLAYLSEVAAAAEAATNYTDAAIAPVAAATNDFLHTSGGSMRGRIRFPYVEDYGVEIGPNHPGALEFRSSYPDYEDVQATLDLSRIPVDEWGSRYTEVAFLSDIPESITPAVVTNIVRDLSSVGIWDSELEVWWTPKMRNGSLTYEATTNVNLNAEN